MLWIWTDDCIKDMSSPYPYVYFYFLLFYCALLTLFSHDVIVPLFALIHLSHVPALCLGIVHTLFSLCFLCSSLLDIVSFVGNSVGPTLDFLSRRHVLSRLSHIVFKA